MVQIWHPQVAKARQKCIVSPAAAQHELTAAERQKLDTAHANRMKELAAKHCPAVLKSVRAHKVLSFGTTIGASEL